MMDGQVQVALERALQLSIELLAVAEGGDVQATAHLDAERLRLLDSVRHRSTPIDTDERLLLQRITELNCQAIGFLEHRQRIKAREMDTATLGRRALVAYSATRMQR
jgi:hypothetical protein